MIGGHEFRDDETGSSRGVCAGDSIEFDIAGTGLSTDETFRRTQVQISAIRADIGGTCYVPENQVAAATLRSKCAAAKSYANISRPGLQHGIAQSGAKRNRTAAGEGVEISLDMVHGNFSAGGMKAAITIDRANVDVLPTSLGADHAADVVDLKMASTG